MLCKPARSRASASSVHCPRRYSAPQPRGDYFSRKVIVFRPSIRLDGRPGVQFLKDLESIFCEAREFSLEDRGAFLDRVCEGDPQLRARVEEMLSKTEDAEVSFSERGDLAEGEGELRTVRDVDVSPAFPPAGLSPSGLDEGDRVGPYTLRQKIGKAASV